MHFSKSSVSIILALAGLAGCHAGSDHRSAPQPQASLATGLGAASVASVVARGGHGQNAAMRPRLASVVAFRVRPTWP